MRKLPFVARLFVFPIAIMLGIVGLGISFTGGTKSQRHRHCDIVGATQSPSLGSACRAEFTVKTVREGEKR